MAKIQAESAEIGKLYEIVDTLRQTRYSKGEQVICIASEDVVTRSKGFIISEGYVRKHFLTHDMIVKWWSVLLEEVET